MRLISESQHVQVFGIDNSLRYHRDLLQRKLIVFCMCGLMAMIIKQLNFLIDLINAQNIIKKHFFTQIQKYIVRNKLNWKLSRMDAKISVVTEQEQKGVFVAQFKAQDIAVFSYYVESEKECYIIDPLFDDFVFKSFIKKRGATLKYVLLTHYHADFLTAHAGLGVPVIMGQKGKRTVNNFEVREVKDNQKFKLGKVETRVIATPGHTAESACFILSNEDGVEFCIFTGDTVLLREMGKIQAALTQKIPATELAEMFYDSIQRIKTMDKGLRIYPGHGPNLASRKSDKIGNFCTLAVQLEKNPSFLINDKNLFVKKLTEAISGAQSYYTFDARVNQQGIKQTYEQLLKKCRKPLNMQQFYQQIEKKVVLVDTRPDIKNGIIQGSYWMSVKGDIATWISMVIKPQQQFLIITEVGKQEQVIERFLRIGFFKIIGYNNFDADKLNQSKLNMLRFRKWDQLDLKKKYLYLDVRSLKEWENEGVLQSSLLVSLPDLMQQIEKVERYLEVDKESQLVVLCKNSMRAKFASSILLKHNINTLILMDTFDSLKLKGVKITDYRNALVKEGQCCEIF